MTFRRAARFAKSAARHAAAGFPKCTQEEIDVRLAICERCDELIDGVCQVCECNCNRDQKWLNKLAWADETCPLLKWNFIERGGGDGVD